MTVEGVSVPIKSVIHVGLQLNVFHEDGSQPTSGIVYAIVKKAGSDDPEIALLQTFDGRMLTIRLEGLEWRRNWTLH
jgi:hypothetical protein